MNQTKLILASQSPRRKALLAQLGYEFTCLPTDIDESVQSGESARDYVHRLAIAKAQTALEQASEQHTNGELVVLGSDTTVVFNDHILGKPEHFEDFNRMMTMLSGQCHQVLTSIAAVSESKAQAQVIATDVWFKQLSSKEISDYWQTGEPQDKAGGYGIQGIGGQFVSKLDGSFFAVMGLPLYETSLLLNQFGVTGYVSP
ncbi:septum formation inhibitor Maf [Thalassotalea euphylliae]|uniref:dTTP/UTP pyrophosphatase n=1 Tax=Thalassotalea euphylliae TaxID=1655234 RepID=A0A3E0TVZ6_9GAMM|nr:Maf family protein [Thalassotalea euphylliae]REL28155.1 septum formation inhibitor Maf [Thalassotalea euphylliae]